ncbi:hypothetical protein BD410DRAFT_817168 [Rickenella mellea]|uniref:Uncharacterized protein n=1 Tax=Rickenella mellea TaxID=50990 RepID=A0A4Y7PJ74_9AGAM|nr:hypothetical protein BD410DRAFT_817168 [Rickenella mellea]
MHLIWLNLIPNLVLLWTNNFKDLASDVSYILQPTVWESIGHATAESGNTIPSAFGARVPNIAKEKHYFTAETWSFWSLYLAPVLLRQRFRNTAVYTHFVKLVKLIHICLQFDISADDRATLRSGFREWVVEYERLYYELDPSRLSACPITVHALLHIVDSIESSGPVWTSWAFVMERYCGSLRPAVRSRRFPFASMDTHVQEKAQLSQVKLIYDLADQLALSPIPRELKAGEYVCDAYPKCVLMPPKVKKILDDPNLEGLRHKVAVCLATRFNVPLATAKRHVPKGLVAQWGKVRIIDGGDVMHARDFIKLHDGNRDASFVRYQLLIDKNARYRNRRPEYEARDFFGQLRRIIVLHLEASNALSLEEPITLLLGAIRRAKLEAENIDGMKFYKDLGEVEVVDLAAVQCVIGRVKDRAGLWGIIDRSGPMAQAEFLPDWYVNLTIRSG